MKNRQLISIILIILLITIGAWLVKEYIQPNLSANWNRALNYFIIAFPVVGGLITAMIATVDSLQAIQERKEKCIISNKQVAKQILSQLYQAGYRGVRVNMFNLHIIDKHKLSEDERMQICEELESCGYIKRDSVMVKITKRGEKYMKS